MQRVLAVMAKEFIQLRRDPRLLALLVVAPVIQLVVLGFAVSTDVRQVTVAVHDDDRTPASREYVRALGSSGYLKTLDLGVFAEGEDAALIAGRAGLVLVIPTGLGRDLARGGPVDVQVLVDGADSNFAVQGLNYLLAATRLFNARLASARQADHPGLVRLLPRGIALAPRVWYNPDLQSTRYLVPGLLGILLLTTTTLIGAMALVKEQEEGTLEQLIITPLRRWELIASKLLPFALIGLVELTVALPVVRWVFGIPLLGSLGLLYTFGGLFLLGTLGLGLFISTLVRTQQQAMLVAAFSVMMPFALLSGFIFPIASMPVPIRVVTPFIPMTHFLIALRALFLKAAGWHELWPRALALLAWGVAILSLAILRFRKRLA